MFALTIVSLVAGFVAGLALAFRFLPPLATTQEGTLVKWLVRLLLALALSWTCVQIYLAIHAYANGVPPGIYSAYERSGILTRAVESILMPAAILVGVAAIVFLLAPAVSAPDTGGSATGESGG